VLYWFAHGTNATHIVDWFNIGASNVRKYIDIVCDILCDKRRYLPSTLIFCGGEHLHKIFACFCDIMGISTICEAIDGTHISLTDLPNKRMTFVASDLFNRTFFHNIVLQVVGMCVLVTLAESTMVGSSRCQAFISNWRIVKYYKSPWWLLEVLDACLFLIGDVTYPIQPYLQKTWKTHNPNDVNKIWYVSSLNFMRSALGLWRIGGICWSI